MLNNMYENDSGIKIRKPQILRGFYPYAETAWLF